MARFDEYKPVSLDELVAINQNRAGYLLHGDLGSLLLWARVSNHKNRFLLLFTDPKIAGQEAALVRFSLAVS